MTRAARILVVDDNLVNLKLACEVLEMGGFEVVPADGAAAALAVLAVEPVALILMDIQMPGMDGLTLTRRIKADPAYRHIPIVALTAFAMKGDEEKARAAGCDDYITKPIDTRALAQRVSDILARRPEREARP